MSRTKEWTPEEDEVLVKHWADGVPASQIAIILGAPRTKASVLGRLQKFPNIVRKNVSKGGWTAPVESAAHKFRFGAAPSAKVISAYKPPVFVPRTLDIEPTINSIMDLRERHCRFPHDGDKYCGRPRKEGSSYCCDHHELCYDKSKGNYVKPKLGPSVLKAVPRGSLLVEGPVESSGQRSGQRRSADCQPGI